MALLAVRNLRTAFASPRGEAVAVRDLTFHVHSGETVAIVGESGSGKSVTALSILRLLQAPPAVVTGSIEFDGRDLLTLQEPEMRKLRGGAIGMVFQEPMSSLNPVLTIGSQVSEAVMLHQPLSRREARARALALLSEVGIPAPERRLKEYPHQLSGGMRQRVVIAIALACDPKLLIADEPTTALDVTVQAQILALVRALQARSGSAVVLITHDLGVVAELADRVIIMYAGRKVEEATTSVIFSGARHPYTKGLLGAVPRIGGPGEGSRTRLTEIPGTAPGAGATPTGCAFAPRCRCAVAVCTEVAPTLTRSADGHEVACHRAPVFAS